MKQLQQRVQDQVTAAVIPYKCNGSVTWDDVAYPPTVNDVMMTGLAREAAAEVLGADNVSIIHSTWFRFTGVCAVAAVCAGYRAA